MSIASASSLIDDRRNCWVCFATEDDDADADWVKPCRCKGTTRWVHQSCLQRWIDEKQLGNDSARVQCPQCNTEYLIVFPRYDGLVYMLDVADRVIYQVSPFMFAGAVVGAVYWSAVTYGAVTVMQVLGHKEAINVMEQADPAFLLVGLPTIPIVLILGRMVRWEECLLKLWLKHSSRLTGHKYALDFLPGGVTAPPAVRDRPPFSDPLSAARVICGALLFPTIATLVGRFCFSGTTSQLQRTILGGLSFVAVKGAVKMYLKHQQYARHLGRRVLDFDDAARRPETTSERAVNAINELVRSLGESEL